MNRFATSLPLTVLLAVICSSTAWGQATVPSLEESKAKGVEKSRYHQRVVTKTKHTAPTANVAEFKTQIQPLLKQACFQCHGPSKQEGELRLDALDPDLLHGADTAWWLEVFNVLSNGEMPPPDAKKLAGADRGRIIDWLSHELQVASQVARNEQGHSSFRRLTRYEYNYALQDLLGLSYDFVEDLPPEAVSEDGFLNSSEMLQMSAVQFQAYREIARNALRKATVRGPQPKPVYYSIKMDFELNKQRDRFEAELEKLRKKYQKSPEKLQAQLNKRKFKQTSGAHYRNLESGYSTPARWSYRGASYARTPTWTKPDVPPILPDVAVIPNNQKLIIDLGDHLPDEGVLRMRIRARAYVDDQSWVPSLEVFFGHQAANNSKAEEPVGNSDIIIASTADKPQFYEFEIPLGEVTRNPFRGVWKLGQTPNPAEYIMLRNNSGESADIQIDYVEITAPFYSQWPPSSHQRVFGDRDDSSDEKDYVGDVLAKFMTRAWRRPPTQVELKQKLSLYETLRPQCESLEEATLEVLATIISSPKFLYLVRSNQNKEYELATRLAIFLWASLPDEELLSLAAADKLSDPSVFAQQVERMLSDSRAQRLSRNFVRQWLGMQLLDHLQTDNDLREAMQEEPIAFFHEILRENSSILDFLHADYALVNATLAKHYGLPKVYGNQFRRVALPGDESRGGVLTQAGLLAMNSDGKDSHPLKRGIWLLENILNDPPPSPPPAVPEIDLTDPDILKLTLKERMEDHRSDPACMSCHRRIDPWGIAFENFDAMGRWRTSVAGKPVDASSVLFNNQELHGVKGLKQFLLENRQDQFAEALTHKLTSYALGRPLSFADRGEIYRITAELRRADDGLRTLIKLIVTSELFQSMD